MNYAVINDENKVVNVILWDGTSAYDPGPGLTLVRTDTAGIGMSYDPLTGAFLNL